MDTDVIGKIEDKIQQLGIFIEAIEKIKPGDTLESKVKPLFAKEDYMYMLNEATHLVRFLKEVGYDFKKSKIISDFYESVKDSAYKRRFVIVDGNIEEAVKGTISDRLKELEKSGVIEQIKNILEQEVKF